MPVFRSSARVPVGAVWAVLVVATVVSFALGSEHGPGAHTVASAVIIAVALFKVRLVGLYFMDLRQAPAALRAAFEVYVVVLLLLLLGLFLIR